MITGRPGPPRSRPEPRQFGQPHERPGDAEPSPAPPTPDKVRRVGEDLAFVPLAGAEPTGGPEGHPRLDGADAGLGERPRHRRGQRTMEQKLTYSCIGIKYADHGLGRVFALAAAAGPDQAVGAVEYVRPVEPRGHDESVQLDGSRPVDLVGRLVARQVGDDHHHPQAASLPTSDRPDRGQRRRRRIDQQQPQDNGSRRRVSRRNTVTRR